MKVIKEHLLTPILQALVSLYYEGRRIYFGATKACKHNQTEKKLVLTRVWQKWRFSAPQTHLWLIKVWFSASTFVVKIATFAKPEIVSSKTPSEFFWTFYY
jgi:hypothetical protein